MDARAIFPVKARSLSGTISIAVVFTLYVAVVFGFGLYLFAFLVTRMRADLGFAYAAMGVVTGGAQLAYLAAALLCSKCVERFGEGFVITAAVFAAATLLVLFAGVQSIVQVGLVLAGLGAAAAFMVIPTVRVISNVVPFAYRSRVNGLVSSGTAYGQFMNGLVVTAILPEHGWRTVWIAIGSMALIVAILGLIAMLLFTREVFSRDTDASTGKVAQAGEWDRVFTGQNFTVWLLFALNGMTCGPWQNYLASFLSDERAWPMTTIGSLWTTVGTVGLFSGFLAGMAADKLGVKTVLMASYAILACAAVLVAVHDKAWQLQTAAVCFGLSFYAVYGLIPAYITKTVAARSATAVFAIANVFLGIGTTLGNLLGGYMPRLSGTLQTVFFAAVATACLGAVMTMALREDGAPSVGG